MRDLAMNSIEQMIYAARACPEPSPALRREALAKSVRAYHERAQRRRMWIAASLFFGLLWTAGSAQQLLAQPDRARADQQQARLEEQSDWFAESEALPTDEWHTVERTLQSRFERSQRLRAMLGPGT